MSSKKMKKNKQHLFTFIAFLLSLMSCNNSGSNGEFKSIPRATWHRDSLVVFPVQVTDTTNNHNLYINVRNDIDYKYSNLWLFINVVQPGTNSAVTDTLEVTLADPAGKWLGQGFGGVKTSEVLFKKNVYFPVSGMYKIEIKQGMRGFQLEGITEIGYRLEKK